MKKSYKTKNTKHFLKQNSIFVFFISFVFMILFFVTPAVYAGGLCKGHFVNPISDICWECLFPITIGSINVVHSDLPDTDNPGSPIGVCPADIGWRIGLNIGYWEPTALTDVTPEPYCMVNLGIKLDLGKDAGTGGKQIRTPENSGAFYYVHWYKYPLIYWLQILTSVGCMQAGEFDIGYITELDPTWNDDETAFVLNPEAVLFGNSISQAACTADVVNVNVRKSLPIDSLFWCAGAQGSLYPLTGTVVDETSPVQSAVLLSERLDFKLHREGLIFDSVGEDAPAVCHTYPSPFLPKSRYRYQMVNTVADGDECFPFGHVTSTWETGHIDPGDDNQYGFLIWQKRNCTFL